MNKAIVEGASPNREWVWHYTYDGDQRPFKTMMPSAMSAYTPVDAMGGPSYTASTSVGLVHAYEYDADHYPTKMYVRAAGDNASLANFALVREMTYRTSDHTYLPLSQKLYTDPSDRSTADKIETTTYDYGFHGATDKIAWLKVSVESELVGENGPNSATTYDSYELFSGNGLNEWSMDELGALSGTT